MSLINIVFFFDSNLKEAELRTTYECGFIPFTERRMNFNVNFHTVAILFIIFDLEVLFLFPWAITFLHLGFFGFYAMVLFFLILTIGILFEFKADILNV
jgi:NADH-quinone oxidoreductase subunit A